MKKSKKLVLSCVAATLMTASAACFLPACSTETKHPEVTITIEFQKKTYEVNYKLYRNLYAQTVKHFIELADNGFYDNMLVHDFKTLNDFVSGLYNYDETAYATAYAAGAPSVRTYLVDQYKLSAYNALYESNKMTYSVYSALDANGNFDKDSALRTVMGEFSDNQHKIENGALSAVFGSLKMVYYTSDSVKTQVYTQRWNGKIVTDMLKYDSATSAFAMQVGSSTSYTTSKYAVFGMVASDKDKETLTELVDLIADLKDDSDFNIKTITDVDTTMADVETISSSFNSFTTTEKPLVIKSVKVKKH